MVMVDPQYEMAKNLPVKNSGFADGEDAITRGVELWNAPPRISCSGFSSPMFYISFGVAFFGGEFRGVVCPEKEEFRAIPGYYGLFVNEVPIFQVVSECQREVN